jgi:AraC-like DNA-binding protein
MKSDPRSGGSESPFLWARGIAARETLRYLDRNRIDAEPLLAKAELSRDQLSQEGVGVSVASQYRFLELAAIETNDSLLGLHVAAEMDVRDIGILFYLTASSATVADALEHVARYIGTTNEASLVEISRGKAETVVTVRRMPELDEPRRQFSEFSMLEAIRAFSRETNRDFAPSRVTFAHVRNSELKEVHRILRCPVEFMHSTDSWILPESVMEQPIVSKDSHLLQILEAHAEDLLSERRKAPGLHGLVENHLIGTLPSGRAQAVVVAEQFGMSARSFTRHIAREGTSFSQILGHVRSRLALRYLEDRRVSLQQIAWLLGYSELAAFNHAFRRWFAMSPRKARSLPSLPREAQPRPAQRHRPGN